MLLITRIKFSPLCFSFLFGTFFIFNINSNAQNDDNTIFISGVVYDFQSNETLPYVHVRSVKTNAGTVSDAEGKFQIDGIGKSDTLIFSFIGYHQKLIFGELFDDSEVYLKPKTELLSEVNLLADNMILYDLLVRCKKENPERTKSASTYFSLETFIGEKQVEMLECYFNGRYEGYDLKELKLKNGRIGLDYYNDRFFISLQTSKALNKHSLLNNNMYFPDSPFQMSKRKLLKYYNLRLTSKFKDDDGNSIYVIDYRPYIDTTKYFHGRVWLDSTQERILKVNLNITNAENHPFIPIWESDTLKQVDFEITKVFQPISDSYVVKSIDFNYKIKYKNRDSELFEVSSKAILVPYDYENIFILPFFDIDGQYLTDYIKILAAPYNDFFWENMTDFGMNIDNQINGEFIEKNAVITSRTMNGSSKYFNSGFMENPYVEWNSKRIRVIDKFAEGLDYSAYDGMMPSKRYKFKAHIYLDLNFKSGKWHNLTKTIYDPFQSYYHYPSSDKGHAFVNMYFDLMEINRRSLEKEISDPKLQSEDIIGIYERHLKEAEQTANNFFKDVDRLENRKASKEWNELIKNSLGIDNLEKFKVTEED